MLTYDDPSPTTRVMTAAEGRFMTRLAEAMKGPRPAFTPYEYSQDARHDPAFAVEWWEKERPEDREYAKIMRPDGGGRLFELVEPV